MKKLLIGLLLLVFVLSGCKQLETSLQEPVDPNDQSPIEIVIDKGSTWQKVANELSDKRLIASRGTLLDYVKEQEAQELLKPGTYTLKRSMDLTEIVKELTSLDAQTQTVKVTIPEGYEVRQIAQVLEDNKVINAEDFLTALEDVDVKAYPFLANRGDDIYCEGYLFPDTYEFYVGSDGQQVLDKFFTRFKEVWTPQYDEQAKTLDMSQYEILILASIIEREARVKEEFPIISSVFHNRLAEGMPLQACSTVQYILKERKPVLSADDVKIESPFNTYQIKGLPPTPIASPGKNAIEAALMPKKTDYKFFVLADVEKGNHYFAKTYEEHLENIEKSGIYDDE